MEPQILYAHPLLNRKFGLTDDHPVMSDDEIERLIEDYIHAAKLAQKAGFHLSISSIVMAILVTNFSVRLIVKGNLAAVSKIGPVFCARLWLVFVSKRQDWKSVCGFQHLISFHSNLMKMASACLINYQLPITPTPLAATAQGRN